MLICLAANGHEFAALPWFAQLPTGILDLPEQPLQIGSLEESISVHRVPMHRDLAIPTPIPGCLAKQTETPLLL